MLKQKRNSNIKFKVKKTNNKYKKRNKRVMRVRKIFKSKSNFINPRFQGVLTAKKRLRFSKKLDIRITPNNIFCTLKSLTKNKTLKVGSSGKYKIRTSKKTLKFNSKIILGSFLNEIKHEIKLGHLILNLTGPIRLRKKILKQMTKSLRRNSLTININQKKCFNGCRPQKKRRKKQKGLRIFK